MFRKHLLAPTILSLACVLLIADTAQAQRRGIFGARRGVTVGPVDAYSYSPSYSYSDYYTPSQQYPQQQGPMDDNTARIRVIVPDSQARVFFDGAPTQQTGTERLYYTPPLQATATNAYRIRATWNQGGKEMTQERVINVNPGRMTVIDFTRQQGEQIPQGQQPAPLPQDTILEGKILRTGQDQFVIQTRDNREVTVFTNPETRYVRNNNPAVFTDLRMGTSVNVNFRMDGKRHIGNTITIRP